MLLLTKKRNIFTGILHVNDAMQEKNLGNEADFKTILDHLQAVYCGKIAYEFMHLPVSLHVFFLTTLHQKIDAVVYTFSLLTKDDGGIMQLKAGRSLSWISNKRSAFMKYCPNQR